MSESKKPRVLVTLVEAGMGHIVSAMAISDAIKKNYSDKVEVIDRYILRDSGSRELQEYEKYMVKNVQWYSQYPSFGYLQYFAMYLLGPQRTLRLVHNTALKKVAELTVAEYRKIKPDVIVCTHHFTFHCAVKYRERFDKNVKVVSYCPDNNVHGWWDVRGDMIYTNNPIATSQAYRLKFKSGQVRDAFYPTRQAVLEVNESKEFYRKKFGIPDGSFAVALADGVYSCGKAKEVCWELLESDCNLTVCFLAGKNDEVKQEIDELKDKVKPNITLLTFGFMENAPELYRACDLFVTKSGPNAVLDSVMMDTPVIIDFCATPIEYATKNLFTQHFNCGYFIELPTNIKKKVEYLAQHPEELRKFDSSIRYFDKSKNGAEQIAKDIISLMFTPQQHLQSRFEYEDSVIDRYVDKRLDKAAQKLSAKRLAKKRAKALAKSAKFKRKLHSGKRSRKFASIIERVFKDYNIA